MCANRTTVFNSSVEIIRLRGMKHYRCYLYDAHEHRVAVHSARHADDSAAVTWAQRLHMAHPEYPAADLWHGDHLVWQSGPGREVGAEKRK